ncbi:hypothetical protein GCM10008915_36860 [Bifidobacterium pullorum subsp. gallinarum]
MVIIILFSAVLVLACDMQAYLSFGEHGKIIPNVWLRRRSTLNTDRHKHVPHAEHVMVERSDPDAIT